MSKQNKWAGNMGKVASGGSGTKGTNGAGATSSPPAPTAKSSPSQNVITTKFSPGDSFGTQTVSTHNSINAFTRGIKSRGPYGGPSFASLNHYKPAAQSSNTQAISKFSTPSTSGSGQRGTVGGSGSAGNSSKVGSSRVNTTPMAKAPRSNKSGSGRQGLVR